MQPRRDDHQVRRPAVHVPEELAEGHVVFEVEDVFERLHLDGVVVVHQKHAREGEDDEEVEGDAAHAPREGVARGVAVDLRRVEVEEDVREYGERAVARVGAVVRDAED